MEEEQILKLECTLDRIFYPKYAKKIKSGEFGIFRANVVNTLENTIYPYGAIKLKGTCPSIEYGTTYKVYCKLSEQNEQYGDTYEIIYISKMVDISNKNKQKEFLKNIINENLVEKLFETYDDVIKLLEEKDTESLMKIRGIGINSALKLIDNYEESKDYSSIYIELGELGLTHTFIKKLVDFYHSPDVVVEKVKYEPYDLVQVEGVGFKKADEIACKVGIQPHDSRRIRAFFLHYLNEQGEMGKSYLDYQELMSALYDSLGFVPEDVVNAVAKSMIEDKDVIVLNNGVKVALKKFYDLEKNIMNELFRLQIGRVKVIEKNFGKNISVQNEDYIPKTFNITNWQAILQEVEAMQGFEFTDEQKAAIKLSLD